jgi:hypothetical protein
VDAAVVSRWEPAKRRADAATGATLDDKLKEVRGVFSHELSVIGAATGGAAAAPGFGTAVSISAATAELGWIAVRITDLILTVAVIHGHGKASVAERRGWVLTILGFSGGATAGVTKLASEAGKGLGTKATRKVPIAAVRSFNRAIGRTIVQKYGTTRGVITLGQALPFGVGAVIGAGGNYITVRWLTAEADRFFRRLPFDDGAPNLVPLVEPTPPNSSGSARELPHN